MKINGEERDDGVVKKYQLQAVWYPEEEEEGIIINGMLVVYIQWKILFSVCIDSYESYHLVTGRTRDEKTINLTLIINKL